MFKYIAIYLFIITLRLSVFNASTLNSVLLVQGYFLQRRVWRLEESVARK